MMIRGLLSLVVLTLFTGPALADSKFTWEIHAFNSNGEPCDLKFFLFGLHRVDGREHLLKLNADGQAPFKMTSEQEFSKIALFVEGVNGVRIHGILTEVTGAKPKPIMDVRRDGKLILLTNDEEFARKIIKANKMKR